MEEMLPVVNGFFIPLSASTGAWGINETFRFTSVS
jgi:hypothetical protein